MNYKIISTEFPLCEFECVWHQLLSREYSDSLFNLSLGCSETGTRPFLSNGMLNLRRLRKVVLDAGIQLSGEIKECVIVMPYGSSFWLADEEGYAPWTNLGDLDIKFSHLLNKKIETRLVEIARDLLFDYSDNLRIEIRRKTKFHHQYLLINTGRGFCQKRTLPLSINIHKVSGLYGDQVVAMLESIFATQGPVIAKRYLLVERIFGDVVTFYQMRVKYLSSRDSLPHSSYMPRFQQLKTIFQLVSRNEELLAAALETRLQNINLGVDHEQSTPFYFIPEVAQVMGMYEC